MGLTKKWCNDKNNLLISRHYHPTLSILSKPIRSLLSSLLFFTTCSLLNSAYHLIYLSFCSPDLSTWFPLYQNLNPLNAATRLLVPILPVHIPSVGTAYAVVSSSIYVLNGPVNNAPSNNVWILNCRFHTWRSRPPMRVSCEFAVARVVNARVYLINDYVTDSWTRSECCAEALDPSTGLKEAVASPVEVWAKWMHVSAVIDKRVYALADWGGVVYDPKSRVWEGVEKRMDERGRACVVHGMLYCYDYLGKIRGFDAKNRVWKGLKEVEKKLPKFLCGATMANVGETALSV
ncbi:hypothetical protein ACLB2K_056430 [Fragaria x ananassa]